MGADSTFVDSLHQKIEVERKRADTDALTQIPNRAVLDKELKSEVEWAQRYDEPFSLIIVDADHFKQINHRYGHPGGDAVLYQLVARMQEQMRGVDILARYGGEEFGILLRGTDYEEAMAFAERIRKSVEECPFTFMDAQIPVTISLGVASLEKGWSKEKLLFEADRCANLAKDLGRNQVVGFKMDALRKKKRIQAMLYDF